MAGLVMRRRWSQYRTMMITARVNKMTPTMIPVFCSEVKAGAGIGDDVAVAVAVVVTVGAEVGVGVVPR